VTLNLADKQAIVAEVSQIARQAISFVAADYRGLTVPEMTQLRKEARNAGVYLRVVRNTLARRAVEGTSFECVQSSLVGPLILAFGETEPSAPAKLFKQYAKDNAKFEVKVLSVGGQVYSAAQIDAVASLPTREEALAKLMSVMQAPITKLVRTFVAPQEKLVRTLAAVRDQKQSA
jgi:large subunit ribosomal protein L10